jgi:hypothetical protein
MTPAGWGARASQRNALTVLAAAEDAAALLAALEIPAAPVVRQVRGSVMARSSPCGIPNWSAAWLLAVRDQESKAVGRKAESSGAAIHRVAAAANSQGGVQSRVSVVGRYERCCRTLPAPIGWTYRRRRRQQS